MSGRKAWPHLATLLPHAGPARFVREILEQTPETIRCRASVPRASAYARQGRFPAYLLLEVAAQCAAVLEALAAGAAAGAGERRREGYLVRARGVRMTGRPLEADRELIVEVQRSGSAGAVQRYEALVSVDGVTVFSGGFSTYVEPTTGG